MAMLVLRFEPGSLQCPLIHQQSCLFGRIGWNLERRVEDIILHIMTQWCTERIIDFWNKYKCAQHNIASLVHHEFHVLIQWILISQIRWMIRRLHCIDSWSSPKTCTLNLVASKSRSVPLYCFITLQVQVQMLRQYYRELQKFNKIFT